MLQFRPRNLELPLGALVLEPLQAYVFHQDVQAVDEGPRRGVPVCLACVRAWNTPAPQDFG